MLKLYHLPISFNSRRVWVALLEKGLEFKLIPMKLDGDQYQPEFLSLNPFHHIPVLVDGDLTMIESLAILDYLEAEYPNPALLPKESKALGVVRMVEMITVNELLPSTRPLVQQTLKLATVSPEQIEQAKQQISNVLSFLENCLGDSPYFAGNSLTLADIVAGTAITILPSIGMSLENYPQLNKWLQSLEKRESWQQTQATAEDIKTFKLTMQKLMAKQS